MASTYYIRTDGNDANDGLVDAPGAGGGGPGAWLTLGKIVGAAVSAGDTVRFKRGQTWSGTQFSPKSGVNYEATIESGNKPIIITAGVRSCLVAGCQGTTLSDLDIRNGNIALQIYQSGDVTPCVFNRLTVTNTGGTTAVMVYESVCELNDITTVGNGAATPFYFYTAAVPTITTNATANRCIATGGGNTVSGFVVSVLGTVVLTDCISYENDEDGYSANGGVSVTCVNCIAYNNGADARASSGDGFTCHDTSTMNLHYCIAYNNQKSGFAASGAATGEVFNCVFDSNYHATKAGTGGGINCTGSSTGNWVFKNNITRNHDIELNIANAAAGVIDSDYNNYFLGVNAGANPFVYKAASYASLALYKANEAPSDANSIGSDPMFVDVTNNYYKLLGGSLCINTGVDVGLTTDFDGVTIVLPPNMGAYEGLVNSSMGLSLGLSGSGGQIPPWRRRR